MDRATPNLPSADFGRTEAFYRALGFATRWKDAGWMILERGPLELEFFPHRADPRTTIASACLRVDDLDRLYAAFAGAGLPRGRCEVPRITPVEVAHGLRLFAVVDPDGSLLRCLDNRHRPSGPDRP